MRNPFNVWQGPHEIEQTEINLLSPDLWDGISGVVQCELLRQAEMMVKGTVTVAIGTDSRITTTMSVLGAGGVALLAAAASLIGNKPPDWQLIYAPVVCAIGLLTAAIICAFAIAPTRFLLAGASPQSMLSADAADHQRLGVDEHRLRAALIYSAQRAITHNMTRAIISGARFELALCVTGAGILAGVGFICLWMANRGLGLF
jgi:hypothetical protein